MRLLTEKSVSSLFADPFEQQVLRSAYSYLNNLNDPLRCNSFALVIRELIRIAISRIAPDEEINNTSWRVGFNGKITRKERYRYAISGYLSDKLISNHSEFDTSAEVNLLANTVDQLSKYSHISQGTFNMTDAEVVAFKIEIENAVIEYADTLEYTQQNIQDRVAELTQIVLTDEIMNAIPDALNSISSYTIVEGAVVEQIESINLYSPSWDISGSGYAEVELNYGSSHDGVSIPDSYPLTFGATVNLDDLDVTINNVDVDTSSFYE